MRAPYVLAGLVALVAAGTIAATPAHAAIPFAPCTPAGFQCGQLAVPLDPSGAAGGTLTLNIRRRVAATNPANTAVIGLAGGPGQAAIPFASKIALNIAPALGTRDLIVFDQRGTGSSGELRCSGQSTPAACAANIGPSRAFYRTGESVEDIEAIRREAGYAKVVLYGTSYGTKVAEAYAAKYPANVEALVLDSVVLPEGPDVFDRSTLARVGPALRQMCGATRCRGISGDPRGDIAALVRRLERAPIRGPVVTANGSTARRSVSALDLLDILLAGDFNPTLRADFPAAVRSALRGDVRPILRLDARASADNTEEDDDISVALFATTVCEESAFPWNRIDGPETRANAALRAARAIPRTQLGPFDARVALLADVIPLCVTWPNAAPAPPAPAPLPNVPTLILDGDADLRTTVTDARVMALRIPGAQFLEVPFVGHSVIGSDPTGCARAGVAAFFASQTVQPCTATAPQFPPTRIAPTRLAALPGSGQARKTVNAVAATLQDVGQVFLGIAADRRKAPRLGTQIGGLRAGTARWTATGIRLRRVEYVPGVVVSGFAPRARSATTTVTVSGAAAAHGTVRVLPGGRVVARLGGRTVRTRLPGSAAAARSAAATAWPQGFRSAAASAGPQGFRAAAATAGPQGFRADGRAPGLR
jgi:pimeloyl-ACP methyl ester carboxylesterase